MAESKRDYYEVLGVDRNADDATIKSIQTAGQEVSPGYEPRRHGG